MTKPLKREVIGEGDLTAYLDEDSDFAFELAVLKMLEGHGFACEHSGSYDDPVTQTPREFDLRATKTIGEFEIRLAVECKHLRANFPLLISCIPRRPEEAYHEIIHTFEPTSRSPQPYVHPQRAKAIPLTGKHSIYQEGESVGKSSAQVGRQKDDGIYSSDSDVYKKWAQAVSSAQDLVTRSYWEENCYSIVLPVLVVPDGTLWLADFDFDGSKIGPPRQVERCSYFIGKLYLAGNRLSGIEYRISHLEFVTVAGLEGIIKREGLLSEEAINLIFPLGRL